VALQYLLDLLGVTVQQRGRERPFVPADVDRLPRAARPPARCSAATATSRQHQPPAASSAASRTTGMTGSRCASCARARIARVLTVPLGTPNSLAASAVVSPSRTVACSTGFGGALIPLPSLATTRSVHRA